MHDSITWIGMDVHNESIVVAAVNGAGGTAAQWETPNTSKGKERLAKRLSEFGTIRCAYEAGPCGARVGGICLGDRQDYQLLEAGADTVRAFLERLVISENLAAATQSQALDIDFHRRQIKTTALRIGIAKPVGCHTLRRCFATHLLESGSDIRTRAQEEGGRMPAGLGIRGKRWSQNEKGYGPGSRNPLISWSG